MEYRKEGAEIIRVKDDKIVATIQDGKVTPTAPVYYKQIDVLNAVAAGEDTPAVEEAPASPGEDPLDAALLKIEHLTEDNAGLREQIAHLKRAVEKLATGTQVAHLIPNPETDLMKAVDWDAVPEADPMLGNRTPERKAYLLENHRELATLWKLNQ
tara:strand:- start:1512 stop:1979 length:468 start_codon:yes stop_codon:yes gene_type:complete